MTPVFDRAAPPDTPKVIHASQLVKALGWERHVADLVQVSQWIVGEGGLVRAGLLRGQTPDVAIARDCLTLRGWGDDVRHYLACLGFARFAQSARRRPPL